MSIFRLEPLENRCLFSGYPLSSLPALHSLPGAQAELFLDFDGDPATSWEGYNVPATPAFDLDGDPSTFNATELADIQQIWSRVAEKYSPFNLDVTTVDPGNRDHLVTAQVVIGGNGNWYGAGGEGGISETSGFALDWVSNTGYVFPPKLANNIKIIAEVASHEAGHLFGLSHQSLWNGSTLVAEYNPGTATKAPVMGNSYNSARGLWWLGTPEWSPDDTQDDMEVISSDFNGFGYRPDDYGDDAASGYGLSVSNSAIVPVSGIISQTSDCDWFRFSTTGGAVSVTAAVAAYGPTLDLKLELCDSSGDPLSVADSSSLGETLGATLAAGTYYIVVASHGDYGDVGQYTLTGTVPLDTTGPSPPTSSFHYDDLGKPMSVQFTFAEDVYAGSPNLGNLELTNLTTSTVVPTGAIALNYDSASNTATYTFSGFVGGILPDGNYRAVLHSSDVRDQFGNPMTGDAICTFYFLNGDANRDRIVNIADLQIISDNWGAEGGKTFSQGDLNYDGNVDGCDLSILAARWQQTLTQPSAPLAGSTFLAGARRTATRVVTLIA